MTKHLLVRLSLFLFSEKCIIDLMYLLEADWAGRHVPPYASGCAPKV